MKRFYIYGLMAIFALATSCVQEAALQQPVTNTPTSEQNEGVLLVKFSAEVADLLEQSRAETRSTLTRSGRPSLDEVLDLVGSYSLERVFPCDPRHEERTRQEELHQWYVVRFSEQFTPQEVADCLSPLGEVHAVDFNRTIKRAWNTEAKPLSMEALQRATTRAGETLDPLRDQQWNLINRGDMFKEGVSVKSVKDADVQCEKAWERTMGDPSVIVAVLDEGIFVEHPDLKANIWVNEDEVAGLREDRDQNGYVGDVNGYNFVTNTGVITWNNVQDSGHGTHVAGVISAVNNNPEGIASIAGGDGTPGSGVKIMACQIFSGNVSTGLLEVVRAMKYAADNGAVILQCSWGYVSGAANAYDWGAPGFATKEQWMAGSPLEKLALDYFTHHAGSPNGPLEGGIAVYAAGNEYAPMAGYPGACEEYVSVAATAADFTPAVYTNYGPGTSISAPGGDQDYYYEYVDQEHNYGEIGCILSTLPYNVSKSGYGYMEGTSMACPHVSGVLALAVSYAAQQRLHFKAQELQALLYETATPIDAYCKGKKTYCRYVADVGPIQPMQMNLSDYAGEMGAGQVNATALLAAMEGAGLEMRFPNLYIREGETITTAPMRYFVGGEELTYTVKISDQTVATATPEGDKMLFAGVKQGVTTATITASNGVEHAFNITVRPSASGSGWL